jgi:hypothetical protein
MRTTGLGELIGSLQCAVARGALDRETVHAAIKTLSGIGYVYDYGTFPALVGTESFTDASGDTPSNLAEALLWKLGKWKSYKRFSANYANDDSSPTKTDVVFYAFARHLKDKSNPIYDQHALRALWAICGKLTNAEKEQCRSVLFDARHKWRQTASGDEAIECYELFVWHVNDLVSAAGSATKPEIDHLLMPLGQAIKKSSGTYSEFCSLCGWPENG